MSEPIAADYSNVRITKIAQANPPHETRCSIYGGVYSRNLVYLAKLTAIAKADYPWLQDKDIEIVVYGGDYIKFHMGIEFSVKEVADGYRIGKLEPTLT